MNEALQSAAIYFAVCLGSYLLGSVPFGFIISKKKGIDIQKTGSGNIGSTNVARQLGLKYGILVAFLDGFKGFLATVLVFLYLQSWLLAGLAWLCVSLGHLFPIWLRFRGGKGVSVFIGGLLGFLGWQNLLLILGGWIIALFFLTRRRVSAANLMLTGGLLVSIRMFPVLIYIVPIVLLIITLIWWAHRDNIKRLAKGEEPPLRLPSRFAFLDKLPDDLIGLTVDKLQSFVKILQRHQGRKRPRK